MKLLQDYNLFINSNPINEDNQIITRKGDPYEYKVENDNWFARKKGTQKWFNISGDDFKPAYQKSIYKLDKENPQLRTPNAPNRTNKIGGEESTEEQPKKKKEQKPKTPPPAPKPAPKPEPEIDPEASEKISPAQKQLLRRLRLRIEQGRISCMKPGYSGVYEDFKYTKDKPCIEIHKYAQKAGLTALKNYNQLTEFWPIAFPFELSADDRPFRYLYVNFWSKHLNAQPINEWQPNYDKYFPSMPTKADFPGYFEAEEALKMTAKDFKKSIPDYKTYGKVEAEWLNYYAQFSGIVPMGQNLFDYFDSLANAPETITGKIPVKWRPKSGVVFLPITGHGTIDDSENHPWRGLPPGYTRDATKPLKYILISPNKENDFEDTLEILESKKLYEIRKSTIIILTWSSTYQKQVVRDDIANIKKYLEVESIEYVSPEESKRISNLIA